MRTMKVISNNKADETRILPNNLEAERAILGGILMDNRVMDTALKFLHKEDFYLEGHRRIFERMCDLSATSRPIDLITLKDELERTDELERAGGAAYLSDLTDGLPFATNIEHYVNIIREKAALRRLIQVSNETMMRGYEGQDSPAQILADIEAAAAELAGKANSATPIFHSAADVMKEARPVEIVEGVAWANQIAVMSSESGAGKTFVLLSMAASITSNVAWLGRQVEYGSVAYVTYEGDAINLRLTAIVETQGHRLDNLYILQANEPLSPVIDRDRCEIPSLGEKQLRSQLRALGNSLKESGRPPIRLLVIDTIRASLSGSEDSSECVSAYLRAIRRVISDIPGAAVILAHHAGWQDDKDKKKRERGSSAFRGNSDSTFYLEVESVDSDAGDVRLMLLTYKIRDAEKPKTLHLIRRIVSLNEADKRGEPRTSCVIEPDLCSPEDREARIIAAEEANNRPINLKVLQAIANRPDLASSKDKIQAHVRMKRTVILDAFDRLITLGWLDPPDVKRKPYTITDHGRAVLQNGSS